MIRSGPRRDPRYRAPSPMVRGIVVGMDTSLSEFVPARLSEDEAMASTDREHAEVAFKRDAVALASRVDLLDDEESEALLRQVASVYADHPDYDRAMGHMPA